MTAGKYFVVLAMTLKDAERWAAQNGLPKRQGVRTDGGRWMYASRASKIQGLANCEFVVLDGFHLHSESEQIMDSAVTLATCCGCEISVSQQEAVYHWAIMGRLLGIKRGGDCRQFTGAVTWNCVSMD